MPWPTSADVEHYLKQDLTDHTETVNLALALVAGTIEDACHQPVTAGVRTLSLDGDGSDSVIIPRFPVTAVTAVTVDGELLEPTAWRWSRRRKSIIAAGGRWEEDAAVDVLLTHGWDPLPETLRLLFLRLVGRIIENPRLVSSEGYQGFSSAFPSSPRILTDDEKDSLAPFRVEQP